jgi:hypothetical protein
MMSTLRRITAPANGQRVGVLFAGAFGHRPVLLVS